MWIGGAAILVESWPHLIGKGRLVQRRARSIGRSFDQGGSDADMSHPMAKVVGAALMSRSPRAETGHASHGILR